MIATGIRSKFCSNEPSSAPFNPTRRVMLPNGSLKRLSRYRTTPVSSAVCTMMPRMPSSCRCAMVAGAPEVAAA